MKSPGRLVTVLFGVCLASPGATRGGENAFPAEGSTNYATYLTAQRLFDLEMDEVGQQWVQQMVGITRNTDGDAAFDNMSVRCVGYVQQVRDEWYWTGACIHTDMDGDQAFTTFDKQAHYLVGGTGKYRGISGRGAYKEVAVPRMDPDRHAAVVHHEVHWKTE